MSGGRRLCLDRVRLSGPLDTYEYARPTAFSGQARLAFATELAKLEKFACVILDDIGYVQHDRDEMEVLFTFLAERYERQSVMITTNLVFSEWERIFKDPMTTMAAIDRLVHHSIILDMMSVESYRAETANQQRLPATRLKKSSAGPISSQENQGASTSENVHINGTQSARLIATDGTV